MDLTGIIAVVLSVLVSVPIVKRYLGKAYLPIKEVNEALTTIVKALEDGKISKKEMASIIKECSDVKTLIFKLKK